MASLNVSLPDEMRRFIDSRTLAGAYSTPSEFIRALVRREMEKNDTTQLEAGIRRGLSDIEHGRLQRFNRDEFLQTHRAKLGTNKE